MKAYQAEYSVSTLCRLHNVSESGYYAWLKRMPSFRKLANLALGDRIEAMYRKSRSTYGRPRIQAELVDEGIRVGDKRVARLMRERHCHGASRRKWIVTTTHNRDATTARDSRKSESSPRRSQISYGSQISVCYSSTEGDSQCNEFDGSAKSCVRDEGRPFAVGLQGRAANHLERHWLKTVVVSVKEKAQHYASGMNQEGEHPVASRDVCRSTELSEVV